MWYPEYRQAVQDALSAELGRNVSKNSIRMLPIEEIRIHSHRRSEEYEIANGWMSYANQPKLFNFSVNCATNETCTEVADNIRNHPDSFVSGLEVYYSLQTQRTRKRSVLVKSEHVQSSEMFSKLMHEFPDTNTVFLLGNDLKKLQLEVSSNVIATEITDEDFFVSSDEALNVGLQLDRRLQVKAISSSTFSPQMWDAVFWSSESARPDVTTKVLNDVYDKSDRSIQEAVKRSLVNPNGGKFAGGRSLTEFSGTSAVNDSFKIWASLKASGSWGVVCGYGDTGGNVAENKSQPHSAPESMMDEIARLNVLFRGGREFSDWKGEKFVTKPLQLTRVNLAAFRGTTTVIATLQMRVARTTSELRTRINVPHGGTAAEENLLGENKERLDLLEVLAREKIASLWDTLVGIVANQNRSQLLGQQRATNLSNILQGSFSRSEALAQQRSVVTEDIIRTLNLSDSSAKKMLTNLSDNLGSLVGRISRLEFRTEQKLFNLSTTLLDAAKTLVRLELGTEQKLTSIFNALPCSHQKLDHVANKLLDLESSLSRLESGVQQNFANFSSSIVTLAITMNSSKCRFTQLRLSGTTVSAKLTFAPAGLICIGNSASPTPSRNFLVFVKVSSRLNFLGTESLNGGFVDFRPYVSWSFSSGQSTPSSANSLTDDRASSSAKRRFAFRCMKMESTNCNKTYAEPTATMLT
ncbi:hypothetical protein BV898_13766 [Hypsibius exemplaris]|uniref:Uncharacterized protein n=1 Tax=Hypsibius exemplaris TaxID=2072580 RepID=A0A1W0W9Z1_HYPEX|nr:hypothetical protein BV898_13766 [Hypsibius exemplaris]